jgi:hypothetical protein
MNGAFKRFLRSGLATAVPFLIAGYLGQPKYQALTPLLMALGKFLRDKNPTNTWTRYIPF